MSDDDLLPLLHSRDADDELLDMLEAGRDETMTAEESSSLHARLAAALPSALPSALSGAAGTATTTATKTAVAAGTTSAAGAGTAASGVLGGLGTKAAIVLTASALVTGVLVVAAPSPDASEPTRAPAVDPAPAAAPGPAPSAPSDELVDRLVEEEPAQAPVDEGTSAAPELEIHGPGVDPARETSVGGQTADAPSEVDLLLGARRLLGRDPRAARRMLDEHARRHPTGALAQEREVMRIELDVRSGRDAAARSRAEAFLRRYPGSAAARRVRVLVGIGAEEESLGTDHDRPHSTDDTEETPQ